MVEGLASILNPLCGQVTSVERSDWGAAFSHSSLLVQVNSIVESKSNQAESLDDSMAVFALQQIVSALCYVSKVSPHSLAGIAVVHAIDFLGFISPGLQRGISHTNPP